MPRLLGAEREARLHRARQVGQVDGIALQRQVARLDAAQVQQILDEPPHALGFLADDAAGLARALGARQRAVDERAREAADRRQRRAQVVAHVGQQVAHGAVRARHLARHDRERLGQATDLVVRLGQRQVRSRSCRARSPPTRA